MIIEIEINGDVALMLIVNLLAYVLGLFIAPPLFEWHAKRQLKRWDEEERKQKEAQPE